MESAFPWKSVHFGEKILSYCFIDKKTPSFTETGGGFTNVIYLGVYSQ